MGAEYVSSMDNKYLSSRPIYWAATMSLNSARVRQVSKVYILLVLQEQSLVGDSFTSIYYVPSTQEVMKKDVFTLVAEWCRQVSRWSTEPSLGRREWGR